MWNPLFHKQTDDDHQNVDLDDDDDGSGSKQDTK